MKGNVPDWVFDYTENNRGFIIFMNDQLPENHLELIGKNINTNFVIVLKMYKNDFDLFDYFYHDNVYFDISYVNNSDLIIKLLSVFGPKKLLWGSGSQVKLFSQYRQSTNNHLKMSIEVDLKYNVLEALIKASDYFNLNDEDLADIFFNNAEYITQINEQKNISFKSQQRYVEAKRIIPGGNQLLSKRPEMFAPGIWPPYFSRARGCEVWDLDRNHYYDMSSGSVGTCLLGYNDEDVTKAVIRRIKNGSISCLNPPEEVDLAKKLIQIHPWATNVRFARTGGEICAIAARIARASTDRSKIAISGYHGWHDWYLAANLGDSEALRGHLLPGLEAYGVPSELRGTALPFKHGSIVDFQNVIDKHATELAAIIMEPCRYKEPDKGYLEVIRKVTKELGIILIFDEITIGWKRNLGGAHILLGVNPDMAVFAKALGNGHPMAALVGTEEAMRGAHISFISSTYWTESVGPVAALATINKMEELNVSKFLNDAGLKIINLWKECAKKYDLPVIIEDGFACIPRFRFDHIMSLELNTLYSQLMLKEGFLAGVSMVTSYAHTDHVISLYGVAIDKVFEQITGYIQKGTVKESLIGPVAHTGFKRLI